MKPFRLIRLSVAAVAVGLAVTAGRADQPADLNGHWKGVAMAGPGGGGAGAVDIVVSGTKMTFYSTGNAGAVTITVNNQKSPAWIDLATIDSSTEKIKGIYQIDGDHLTLAYPIRTGDRPTNFQGSNDIVMHFVRDGSATTRTATTASATTVSATTAQAVTEPATTRPEIQ